MFLSTLTLKITSHSCISSSSKEHNKVNNVIIQLIGCYIFVIIICKSKQSFLNSSLSCLCSMLYKCYGLVRTIASQYRLSVQLCSDLVSSSLVACLVLSHVVIYSFILQTNNFVIFVLYIKLYHSENKSRFKCQLNLNSG